MWSEFGEKKKTACLCALRNTKHLGAEIWDFFCGGQAAPRLQKRKKRKKNQNKMR